jgi:predicted RNase H-like HicB family nuclease
MTSAVCLQISSSRLPHQSQETVAALFPVVDSAVEDILSEQPSFSVSQESNPLQVTLHESALDGLARRYAEAATHLAKDRLRLLESGEWVSDLPFLPGLWASGSSPQECLAEFKTTTISWVKLKVEQQHKDIPVLADIDLNIF